MDFVVVAKFAIVAIFPNVATAGIEERVVTTAIRELETDVLSLRQGGLGLKQWCQCNNRKKQNHYRENYLCVKVNAHVSASKFPQIFDANSTESEFPIWTFVSRVIRFSCPRHHEFATRERLHQFRDVPTTRFCSPRLPLYLEKKETVGVF